MHRGLRKKYDFEKGKQKAKAQNPDYKDDLAETRETRDPGGLEPAHITLRDTLNGKFQKKGLRQDHQIAVKVYCDRIKGQLVWVGVRKFKFKLSVVEFARVNAISIADAEKEFAKVTSGAVDRLERTRGLAARAQPIPERVFINGQERVQWCLRFKTFLPTVEPYDWSKAYSRIRICPCVHDTGTPK